MNRAVANDDASESFAGILGRLARGSRGHDAAETDLEAVSVSISHEAVAALDSSRKRGMAPVREAKLAARTVDAAEISYERALQTHRRGRTAGAKELPPEAAGRGSKTDVRPGKGLRDSRAESEEKAISALRRAQGRLANERAEAPLPKAQAGLEPRNAEGMVTDGAPFDDKGKESRKGRGRRRRDVVPGAGAGKSAAVAGVVLSASPAPKRPKAKQRSVGKSPAEAGKASGEGLPRKGSGRSSDRPGSHRLDLELASRAPAVVQRQSTVSIRLSAVESEQLRLRAAESGISVSAYMRSCVLEAEHLRAQVKQALAELRAVPAVMPPPQMESQPLLSATYPAESAGARMVRSGFVGFLSGAFALVLGRFHR